MLQGDNFDEIGRLWSYNHLKLGKQLATKVCLQHIKTSKELKHATVEALN